jgi:hypothetical protein
VGWDITWETGMQPTDAVVATELVATGLGYHFSFIPYKEKWSHFNLIRSFVKSKKR